jgi:outer membrane protein OmpA-like peptidoglycan-associated protein
MSSDDSTSSLASSFTDLMTSLAIIFILLLCVALHNAQQQSKNTRDSILDALKKELSEYMQQGVSVEGDKNDPLGLIILVPEGLLAFEFDRSDVPALGIKFLYSFMPKFAEVVCQDQFRNEISSIVVEGHTDSTGSDQHNLELSQKRSMAVVSRSLQILNEASMGIRSVNPKEYLLKLLSATGRGKADPVIEDGEEMPEKSRRVIFKIRVRSFEERTAKVLINSGTGF